MILKIYFIILTFGTCYTCPFNQCKQYEHEIDPRPMCICGLGHSRFNFQVNSTNSLRSMSVLKIMNFVTIPIKIFSSLEIREIILANSPCHILNNGIFQNIRQLSILELSDMPNLRLINNGPMRLMTNRLSQLRLKNLPSLTNFYVDSFKNLIILDISTVTMNNLIVTKNPNLALVRVQNCDIKNLTISHLPLVNNLFIQNNQIDQIKVNNLSMLNYLSVESNNFKTSPHLSDLFNLRTLILDKNGLDDSIGTLLAKMNNLQVLSLKNNLIKDINFLKNLSNIQNLFLSDNLIEKFDSDLAINWKVLDLESNLIENNLLFTDSSLEILNLNQNKIKDIIIKNLFYLKSVNLGNNLFSRIQILNCTRLKNLEIIHSDLSDLKLENLISMEFLRVKNDKIETLEMTGLDSLIILDLSGTGAEKILSSFSSDQLIGLTVQKAGIKKFPYQIFDQYPNIYGIDFGHNNLTIIENSSFFFGKFVEMANNQIGQIENLDFFISYNFHVDLSFNKLGSLDLRGNENSAIEELLLMGNEIEKMHIYNHPDLVRLNLSLNKMVNFTAENLEKLKILDLSFNQLNVLVITDGIANNLNYLNISSNNLSKFNFEKFESLLSLVARDNLLTSIDLQSMTLAELDLSYNRIENLSFLANFPLLKRLDLSGNLISQIDLNIFDKNLDLLSIDLSNNYLTRVPSVDRLFSIVHLNMAQQNGRLRYIHDFAFSNRYGNNLKVDLSGNNLQSFSKKMLCNKDNKKINIYSIRIDCELRIRKCVYQNLREFLPEECHLKKHRNICNQRSRFVFYEPISKSCPHH